MGMPYSCSTAAVELQCQPQYQMQYQPQYRCSTSCSTAFPPEGGLLREDALPDHRQRRGLGVAGVIKGQVAWRGGKGTQRSVLSMLSAT